MLAIEGRLLEFGNSWHEEDDDATSENASSSTCRAPERFERLKETVKGILPAVCVDPGVVWKAADRGIPLPKEKEPRVADFIQSRVDVAMATQASDHTDLSTTHFQWVPPAVLVEDRVPNVGAVGAEA